MLTLHIAMLQLKKNNVVALRKSLQTIMQFKELIESGLNQQQACKITGLNSKSVHTYIKKYNINVINKFQRTLEIKHDYFNNIDTEGKAYLLGYIIGDGYIGKDNRLSFGSSIDDEEVIKFAQQEISKNSKLEFSNYQQGAKFRKPQIKLRIKSKELCKTLSEKYSVHNNKTNDITFQFDFNLIDEYLLKHFVRGFFDADGSISFYVNKDRYFNFSFIFTSLNFCNQIGSIFYKYFDYVPVVNVVKSKNMNTYQLRFKCKDRNRRKRIEMIYDWFYKDSNIYLTRKKNKFELYLNTVLNSRYKNLESV